MSSYVHSCGCTVTTVAPHIAGRGVQSKVVHYRHLLLVALCLLCCTCCMLPSARGFLLNACSMLGVACGRLHVACCLGFIACYTSFVACCVLLVACCILLVACCSWFGAYCLLHVAYHTGCILSCPWADGATTSTGYMRNGQHLMARI